MSNLKDEYRAVQRVLLPHEGKRVRLTHRNGYQRTGLLTFGRYQRPDPLDGLDACINGYGGMQLETVVRVEVASGRRYQTCWER